MENDFIELERQCLQALAHNFSILRDSVGELHFISEADAVSVTSTAWLFDASTDSKLRDAGAKGALLDTLDLLIATRKQNRIRPNRSGRLIMGDSSLTLEWLAEDSQLVLINRCA